MNRPVAAGILFVLGVAFVSAPAFPQEQEAPPPATAPRVLDAPWLEPADREPEIIWRVTWDETLSANLERWEKELEGRPDAGRRLKARRVALREALMARFPEAKGRRFEALLESAKDLADLGLHAREAEAFARLVEEFPHRPAAREGFRELLDPREDSPSRIVWMVRAAERVLDLARRGELASDDRLVVAAWRTLAEVRRREGRIYEARKALGRLRDVTGRDRWSREAEARLAGTLGAVELARDLYEALLAEVPPESDEARELRDRIEDLYDDRSPAGQNATLPSDPGLVGKWTAMVSGRLELTAADVQAVLENERSLRTVVEIREGVHASVWSATDARLRTGELAQLGDLRILEEKRARVELLAMRGGGARETFALFRRCPWDPAVHEKLLRVGEHLLRRGAAELARRSFEDALARSVDPSMRARAAFGLALALAQAGRDEELARLIEKSDGNLPGALAAGDAGTRERLVETAGRVKSGASGVAGGRPAGRRVSAPAAGTGTLAVTACRLPPVAFWPEDFLEVRDEGEVVWRPELPIALVTGEGRAAAAGPEALAVYGEDIPFPRWTRVFPRGARRPLRPDGARRDDDDEEWDEDRGARVLTSSVRPAIADGRITLRWGVDRSGRRLASVSAFDLSTGRALWSTASDPEWRELWPVCDPVASEGRLFVLAIRRGRYTPVFLLALDAASGKSIWRTEIASGNPKIEAHGARFDLALHGSAVTVQGGAVYCAPNIGVAARIDARDGLLEWVRPYRRMLVARSRADAHRRRGTPPVVAGGRVIFAPRDRAGVFALAPSTGELLWEDVFLPSDGGLTAFGERVVAYDERTVAALEPSTGEVLWDRSFESPVRGDPLVDGDTLVVAAASSLHRLDGRTGRDIESRILERPRSIDRLAMLDGRLLALSSDPGGSTGELAPRESALRRSGARRLGDGAHDGLPERRRAVSERLLPLCRVLSLARRHARLLELPESAQAEGRIFLLSEDLLEAFDIAPGAPSLLWRRRVERGVLGARFAGGLLFLFHADRVRALDPRNGETRWATEAPFAIELFEVAGDLVAIAHQGGTYWRRDPVAVLDAGSGRLLWERELDELFESFVVRGFAHDGARLHVLATSDWEGDDINLDLACRPRDGVMLEARHFLGKEYGWPRAWLVSGDDFYWVERPALRRVSLANVGAEPADDFRAVLDGASWRRERRDHFAIDADETWVIVRQRARRRDGRAEEWVVHRERPEAVFHHRETSLVRGGTLCRVEGDELLRVDLETGSELRPLRLPSERSDDRRRSRDREESRRRRRSSFRLHDVRVRDDRVTAAWSELRRGDEHTRDPRGERLRVGVFGRKYSLPFETQSLPVDARAREFDLAWLGGGAADDALLVVSADGLDVFAPAHSGDGLRPSLPVRTERCRQAALVPRLSRRISADGSLDDWPDRCERSIEDREGNSAELRLAHDGARFHLALAHREEAFIPRSPFGGAGSGNTLEVGLSTNRGSFRWRVGMDERGDVFAEPMSREGVPDGLRAAVRHDPSRSALTYELALPLDEIIHADGPYRSVLGLSLEARAGGGGGPLGRPLVSWGGGLRGADLSRERQQILELEGLERRRSGGSWRFASEDGEDRRERREEREDDEDDEERRERREEREDEEEGKGRRGRRGRRGDDEDEGRRGDEERRERREEREDEEEGKGRRGRRGDDEDEGRRRRGDDEDEEGRRERRREEPSAKSSAPPGSVQVLVVSTSSLTGASVC